MEADYSDQTAIFDPREFTWPIHVIGLGGIGSALVLPLVKLGLRSELHLWDSDDVEPHNVPAQLIYSAEDIGRAKVESAEGLLEGFKDPGCKIIAHKEMVTAETSLSGVVISGVDSMRSRAAIWSAVQLVPEVVMYLDGRMGGEQVQLFTVNPCDLEDGDFYGSWLFSDDEASPLPCAARTVIHPPVVLAGLIINQLTRFVREMKLPRMIDMHVCEAQIFTH